MVGSTPEALFDFTDPEVDDVFVTVLQAMATICYRGKGCHNPSILQPPRYQHLRKLSGPGLEFLGGPCI